MEYTLNEKYSLLSYALVHHYWQSQEVPIHELNGYNVGALTVNEENVPVFFSINSVSSKTSTIQHAETNAIQRYLQISQRSNLAGHTIFSTLEPCIMCVGTMIHAKMARLVYGQHDFRYAHSYERLTIDNSNKGGFGPYPDSIISEATTLPYLKKLDIEYELYRKQTGKEVLAEFLRLPQAKAIFQEAEINFFEIATNTDLNYYYQLCGYKPHKEANLLADGQSVKKIDDFIKDLGRPAIFIGSSAESIPIVEYIASLFDKSEFIVHPWHDGVFGKTLKYPDGTKSNLEWIKNFADIYDFGIFLFTNDDLTTNNRPRVAYSVRHNVIFEFGLFFGRLGLTRSFIIMTMESDTFIKELFTDLSENTDEFSLKNLNYKLQSYKFDINKIKYNDDTNKVDQSEDLQKLVKRIGNEIKQNFTQLGYNFLPATALAFGYFDSLILNILTLIDYILDGNINFDKQKNEKLIKILKNSIERIERVEFVVIMPDANSQITNKFLDEYLPSPKFSKFEFYLHDWVRDVKVLTDENRKTTKKLTLFDIPRTLFSSNQAIEFINGDDQIRELLKLKEKKNFKQTLNHLIKAKHKSAEINIPFEVVFLDIADYQRIYLNNR